MLTLCLCSSCSSLPVSESSGEPEWEGVIEKVTENPRTLSEYYYYILVSEENVRGIILYRSEDNKSRGFEEYLGKEVVLTGNYAMGIYDWRGSKKEGLLVTSCRIK
ncbi:MAG: hypothetical protein PQJ59_18975 [Spirochaetales bacterium]|nr:hypothetical protein [Spirochaetales bacterium]